MNLINLNDMVEVSIIRKFTCVVKYCFIGNCDYKDIMVAAMIVRYKLWRLTWYKIKTYRPKIRGTCNGHYYTRTALNNAVSVLREQCKYFLAQIEE